MSEILLSIVVPTKNRFEYLKSFIDLYALFANSKIELVIQDNSDYENDVSEYLSKYVNQNIVYNYVKKSMPVVDNCELAILNSRGKYVCFVGDDDLVSKYIVDVVDKMNMANIDSLIFNKAIYNWPGTQYVVHDFPSLFIPGFTGKVYAIDPKAEYKQLLRRGATELGKMPQLYHGIIKRSILDEIRSVTGSFFPGPSPDMAIAACLSHFVSNHWFMDAPIISSGKSPKSAAGLGAKHEHKGELKSLTFLPADIEQKWDPRLPFVWTGPTIYAQSAISAINSMKLVGDLEKFNFPYFYAYFDVFCGEYKEQSRQSKEKISLNYVTYALSKFVVFFKRVKIYLSNKLKLKFRFGGIFVDNLKNSREAESIIDKEIERVLRLNNISFS